MVRRIKGFGVCAGAVGAVVVAAGFAGGQGVDGGKGSAVGLVEPVKFEVGKTGFADGDKITIESVRGTSSAVGKGNAYVVTGWYTLASADSARLALSVTAREAKEGYGAWAPGQTVDVKRGSGTFTLVLPMTVGGWPHASFYAGGKSIGETYFGTGETVMRPTGH